MHHHHPQTCARLVVALLLTGLGCSRHGATSTTAASSSLSRTATADPPAASPPLAASASAESAAVPPVRVHVAGNVTSTPSETIATGKPEKPAAKYRSPDAKGGPVYFGNPQMKLDPKTLSDVRAVLEQTCSLLREGVEILEKNARTPEKAAAALHRHHKKHSTRIANIFERAADVKARLKAAGYDQDIPAEVQEQVDRCMTPLFKRLEGLRSVYASHPDVLEAFGRLFPRTPR